MGSNVTAKISATCDEASLACVIVTYFPDMAVLERMLKGLPPESRKILVDNCSAADEVAALGRMVAALPSAELIANQVNRGLAAALNQGIRVALSDSRCRYVLLLDQDSEPVADAVPRMVATLEAMRRDDPRVGAVGPRLRDPLSGAEHGFHRVSRGFWTRHLPSAGEAPVPVDSLNGSGVLAPVGVLKEVGGLREALFIDHVDTEWAFRAQRHGYRIFGLSDATFLHRMGDATTRFWLFGWRAWPQRSPLRHFYLFRNTCWLIRASGVPRVWKVWALIKMLLSFAVFAIQDPRRKEQVRQMLRGIKAGICETPGVDEFSKGRLR